MSSIKSTYDTLNSDKQHFYIYLAIIIFIAIMIFIGFFQKKENDSQTFITIISFISFLSVSFIYLQYLNGITTNQYTFLEKINYSLRNEWVVYLVVLFLSCMTYFLSSGFHDIRENPKIPMIIIGLVSALYLLYTRIYNYHKLFNSTLFIGFIIAIMVIFMYNPYNIIPQLNGLNIFTIVFAFMFVISMILYYHTNANLSNIKILDMYQNIFLILFSIFVSIGVIILLFVSFGAFDKNKPSVGTYILNILIILGMLSVLYKVLDTTGYLKKSPLFKIIVNTALYIPCILTNILELFMSEYYKARYSTLIVIGIELILIAIYMMYPHIISWLYTSDGELLINEPVDLSEERIVSYYDKLSGNNAFDVQDPTNFNLDVGSGVEVEQQNPTWQNATIIDIHSGKYDILFDDGTYQYNTSVDLIKNLPNPVYKINDVVEVTQKNKEVFSGTIVNINNNKYNIKYTFGDLAFKVPYKSIQYPFTINSKVQALQKWLYATIKTNIDNKTYDVSYKMSDGSVNIQNIQKNEMRFFNIISPVKNTYSFSISFWLYLNSMPPNTNINYNKYTSLLNYSNNPNILYNPLTNDLIVAVLKNKDLSASNNVYNSNINENSEDYNVVYSNKNILLQKWNNFVLNYDGGTLDIFYNGELVKSSINIVPNIIYNELKVGTDKGIRAGLCNLVYFKEPLNIITINNLYNLTKLKKIPDVPKLSLFSFNI
jgi:hypothetical protein